MPAMLKIYVFLFLIFAMASTLSTSMRVGYYQYTCPCMRVGYYQSTCPSAEAIVRQAVSKAIARNPGLGAGLIRLHFHDCFVRGCDASILLDSTPGNPSEKEDPANNPSLRGFEVIDEAKAMIEAQCPQTVSCSDILAFAARDSVYKLGGIDYSVPAGRRDGRISRQSDVPKNLPNPSSNAKELEKKFARKGLSLDEMVTLSGAHSIGVCHCSIFSNRLYNFSATHQQDPSMAPTFVAHLRTKCPASSERTDPTVNLDFATPNRLDNRYYKNLKHHRGLLTSDQTLYGSPITTKLVRRNANHQSKWATKFAAAMVHLGSIDVLSGTRGEIRKNCRIVNY